MSFWEAAGAAGAAIDAAFADPEPAYYTGAGLTGAPVSAIVRDEPAPAFDGGRTLRTIFFEIAQADLPQEPHKGERLDHRGQRWRVDEVRPRNDLMPPKWELVVIDAGEVR